MCASRKPAAVLVAFAVSGIAVGCFSTRADDPDDMLMEPQSGVVEIELTDALRFVPDEVVITPGTTVRWITVSTVFHTITPRDGDQLGVFERQEVPAGDQPFEHTFTVAEETYDYFCEPHELAGMVGTIRVVQQ